MKGILVAILCFAIGAGFAYGTEHQKRAEVGERAVRIFFNPTEPTPDSQSPDKFYTGTKVPAGLMLTILFLKEPCPLPIEGAETMLRAWQALAAYQVGCWYPTIDDKYVIINGLGQIHAGGTYWESFPRAVLHSDGSATITEKNYDSDTFLGNIMNEKAMRVFSHMQEKP